jgi:hypothetical protein
MISEELKSRAKDYLEKREAQELNHTDSALDYIVPRHTNR